MERQSAKELDMDNDDRLVGRLLSRREMLALMGGAGLALLVACDDDESPSAQSTTGATRGAAETPAGAATSAATTAPTAASTALPSCVVRPELTEGPYFVDEMLDRSDIRSDPSDGNVKEGAEFRLSFVVSSVGDDGTCEPLAGAMVDIWHCDALGVYSDVQDPGFNTHGQKWLRGFQRTDASGRAEFVTIYPGWYPGRAVHIHFKIRTGSSEFTSQLFFDDDYSMQVYEQEPYASKGPQTLLNENDAIYQLSTGQLTLNVTRQGGVYASTFDIGLQQV
jgi:protocatechuate 3,4-dioxygenase beta subunit